VVCAIGVTVLSFLPVASGTAGASNPGGGGSAWNAHLPNLTVSANRTSLADTWGYGVIDGSSCYPNGVNPCFQDATISNPGSSYDYISGGWWTDEFASDGFNAAFGNPADIRSASYPGLQTILGEIYVGYTRDLSFWGFSNSTAQIGFGATYDLLEYDILPLSVYHADVLTDGRYVESWYSPTATQVAEAQTDANKVASEMSQLLSTEQLGVMNANDTAIAKWVYWQLAAALSIWHGWVDGANAALAEISAGDQCTDSYPVTGYYDCQGGSTQLVWNNGLQGGAAKYYKAAEFGYAQCLAVKNFGSEVAASPNATGHGGSSIWAQFYEGDGNSTSFSNSLGCEIGGPAGFDIATDGLR
jgi:hypothetical protein